MKTKIALLVFGVCFGCKADLPEGTFACESASECPSGWACRSDGLCYRKGDGVPGAGVADGGIPGDATPAPDAPTSGCTEPAECAELPHSVARCEDDACAYECEAEWLDCDDAPGCESSASWRSSCGACGTTCAADELCAGGTCRTLALAHVESFEHEESKGRINDAIRVGEGTWIAGYLSATPVRTTGISLRGSVESVSGGFGTVAWLGRYEDGTLSMFDEGPSRFTSVALDAASDLFVAGIVGADSSRFRGVERNGVSDAFVGRVPLSTGGTQWGKAAGTDNTGLANFYSNEFHGITALGARIYAGGDYREDDNAIGPFTIDGQSASYGGDEAHDGVVVVLDRSTGDLERLIELNGSGDELVRGISADAPNLAVNLAASFTGEARLGEETLSSRGGRDGLLVRLDAEGTTLWTLALGGAGDDDLSAVATAPDGSIWVLGSVDTTVPYDLGGGMRGPEDGKGIDLFLGRYGPDGTHIVSRTFGSARAEIQDGALELDSAGNALLSASIAGETTIDDVTLSILGSDDVLIASFGPGLRLRFAASLGSDYRSSRARPEFGSGLLAGEPGGPFWVAPVLAEPITLRGTDGSEATAQSFFWLRFEAE